MATNNQVDSLKVLDSDTFSIWRDKYNKLCDTTNGVFNLNFTDPNTPIELFKVSIKSDGDYVINLEPNILDSLRVQLVWVYKTVLDENVEEVLVEGYDWYATQYSQLVINKPMLTGDIISVRVYPKKIGKLWTDVYLHYVETVSTPANTTVDTVNNKSTVKLLHVVDNLFAKVLINGVVLAESDYSFTSSGFVMFNGIILTNDVITVLTPTTARDLEKYKQLGTSDEYTDDNNADGLKNILDTGAKIVYEWSVENEAEILDPNINVPTLAETEYMNRTIQLGLNNLAN